MNLQAMREIVSNTDLLNEALRNEARIPFNMRSEQVEAEALIEYAKENAWVLEMAISIAKQHENLTK